MKQIIITILVVAGIVVGAVYFGGGGDQVAGEPSNNFYGQEQGIITVTEYADFECPACAGFFPAISQTKEKFKDQIRFEFKHFPLVQIHTNAVAAHRAAQAAAIQGKFWEMHDLLFQRQQAWNGRATTTPGSTFESYANEIGLDMEKFKADVASSTTLETINGDIEAGKALGTASTPTFYIDGKLVEDLASISTADGFESVVQAAIDAKNGTESSSSEDMPENSETPVTKPEESFAE